MDLSFLKPYLSNDAVKRVEESVGNNSSKKGKVKKQEHKKEEKEEVKEEVLTVRDYLKMKKESRKPSMDILKKNREQPVEEFGSNFNVDCNNRKENIQYQ